MEDKTLILKNDLYEIYRTEKDYPAKICFELIAIAIAKLETMENGGFDNKEDYIKFIKETKESLNSLLNK